MIFNSLTFIVFFAIVLALHNLPLRWSVKKFNLLVASYIFYAAWNPPFVILLWISTTIDWFAAQGDVGTERPNTRRIALLCVAWRRQPRPAGFLQVRRLPARTTSSRSSASRHRLPPPAGHRAAGRDHRSTPSRRMSYTMDVYRGALKPCAILPRLRLVRDVLSPTGGRPDRARQRFPAAVARRRSRADGHEFSGACRC